MSGRCTELTVDSPHTLGLACRALAGRGGRPIAGGTDLIPQMRAGRLAVERLVDLSRLHDLRTIEQEDRMLHVGALTTFSAMLLSPLLHGRAPALAQAAALVGAVQTRNRGTLGGNIANASPAGDTLPPLLAMKATGVRVTRLPIEPEYLLVEMLKFVGRAPT